MPSKFDRRNTREYGEAIQVLPKMKGRPYVDVLDLSEVGIVTSALPNLTFPINSAGELLDALGPEPNIEMVGREVDPVRMIKYMPAYYFPIVSQENFVEKLAELIRGNRHQSTAEEHSRLLRSKLPKIEFPIESADHLGRHIEQVGEFPLGDRRVKANDALKMLPPHLFPIRDQEDLERKTLNFFNSQPLIQPE